MASQPLLHLTAWLRLLWRLREGQDLVEYTVLVGLVTVVCWAAVRLGGGSIIEVWAYTTAGLGAIAASLGG